MNTIRLSLVLVFVVATFACKKKDEEGAGGGDAPAEQGKAAEGSKGKAKPEKAGPQTVTLPKLGIKATIPAGAKVEDGLVGDGHMVTGPGITVSIDPATDMTPATADDAKKEATDMYSATNIKDVQVENGYIITYENKGSMGTNYWMKGVREIDGKKFACSVTAPEDAHQKSGVAICQSLTK